MPTVNTAAAVEPPKLAPHLVCAGAADAMEFYKRAFGAEEMMRLPGPDGKLMHGSMLVNGAMLMLVDENPDWGVRGPLALGGSPVTLHMTVPDVDAALAKAAAAGATITMPAADMFWGDRYGMVKDPFGHNWSIATPQPNPPRGVEELTAAMHAAMPR